MENNPSSNANAGNTSNDDTTGAVTTATFLDTESQSQPSNSPADNATYNHNATPPLADEKGNGGPYRSQRSPLSQRLHSYFMNDVDPKWADLLLILCFFISGLVDSVAFNVWSCFASMQTGNTIFVGLGVSSQPFSSAPYSYAKSLIAIVCFCIGCFFFGHFHRFLGPLRRGTLLASFGIQVTFMVIAAVLATVGVVSGRIQDTRHFDAATNSYTVKVDKIEWNDLAPLALLAFQASGQTVGSRMLKYNELPTVVLTSLYCDLLSDPKLLTAGITEDAKRNRRVVAAIMLFAGAISGGYLTKSWVGVAGALWIAAFLKGCILLSWVFWKSSKKSVH